MNMPDMKEEVCVNERIQEISFFRMFYQGLMGKIRSGFNVFCFLNFCRVFCAPVDTFLNPFT